MSESAEEDEPVLQELSPVRIVEDDEHEGEMNDDLNNMEVADEVDDHAEARPGSSQASEDFTELSHLSPARDVQEDIDDQCPNCCNFRDNTLKAFEAAASMSKLQAQYNDLSDQYNELSKRSAAASMHVEDSYKKLREAEILRDRFHGELQLANEEIYRLQRLNKQYLTAATLADKHRHAADDWCKKHLQTQALLVQKSDRYVDLEKKFKSTVDSFKAAVESAKESTHKMAIAKAKLDQKINDQKPMKKHWNTVVRLIADISRQCSDELPANIRDRVNRLPIDELLQLSRPNADGAEGSDDDDAEALLRLMQGEVASQKKNFDFSMSPPKSRGGARGRGRGRGGRAKSMFAMKNAVDESMHEDMLARKLHRSEGHPSSALPSQPAASSVMGKKTETVREQQERQKAGMKDKMAQLRDEYNAKSNAALKAPVSSASIVDEPFIDVMGSDDDDDHGFDFPEEAPVQKETTPTQEYMEMPVIEAAEVEEVEHVSMYDNVKRRGRSKSRTPQPSSDSVSSSDKRSSNETLSVSSSGGRKPSRSRKNSPTGSPGSLQAGGRTLTAPAKLGKKTTAPKARAGKKDKEQEERFFARDETPPASNAPYDPFAFDDSDDAGFDDPPMDDAMPEVRDDQPAATSAAADAADETMNGSSFEEPMPVIEDESVAPAEEVVAEQETEMVEEVGEETEGGEENKEGETAATHEQLRVEVSVESSEQPEETTTDAAAAAAAAPSMAANLCTPPRAARSPHKSPSPNKMIQHPKVVELQQMSQQPQDATSSPSTKRRIKHQEKLAEMGLDMSDSDDENGDEEEKKEKEKNKEKEEEERKKKAPVPPPVPIVMRSPLKSTTKSPQKSPLALEPPKTMVSPVRRPQMGLSARVNMAATTLAPPAVPSSLSAAAIAAAAAGLSSSTAKAAAATQQPPSLSGSDILDDILAGAHQQSAAQSRKRGRPAKTTKASETIEQEEKRKEKEAALVQLKEVKEELVEMEETPQPEDLPTPPTTNRRSRARSRAPPKTPKTPAKRRREEDDEGEEEEEEERGRRRRQATPSGRKKSEVEYLQENAANFLRGRSVTRRSEDLDGDGGSETESVLAPVSRRTRSKSVPPDDEAYVSANAEAAAPPKTPSKRERTPARARATHKTPSRATKTPTKTPSKAAARTPSKAKTPTRTKTPTKKAATPQKTIELPKSSLALSDESSDEEKEKESGSPMPPPSTTRSSPRVAAAAARSAGRSTRNASIAASAAISRRPSTSTRVEAVPRVEKQGAAPRGAAREAAARLRDEADAMVAAAATPPSRATARAKPVAPAALAAAVARAAAEEDVTPFARNNKRTAMAAPRKQSAAASTESTPPPVDEKQRAIDDPNIESSLEDDASHVSSPPRKRVARVGTVDGAPTPVPAAAAAAAPVVVAPPPPAATTAASKVHAAAVVDSTATQQERGEEEEERMEETGGEGEEELQGDEEMAEDAAPAAEDTDAATALDSSQKHPSSSTFDLSSMGTLRQDDGELPEQILEEEEADMEPGSCIVEEPEELEDAKKEEEMRMEEERRKEEEEKRRKEEEEKRRKEEGEENRRKEEEEKRREEEEEKRRKEVEEEKRRKEEEEKMIQAKKKEEEYKKRMEEEDKERMRENERRREEDKQREDLRRKNMEIMMAQAKKKEEEEKKKRMDEERRKKEEEMKIEEERKKEEERQKQEKMEEENRKKEEQRRKEKERKEEAIRKQQEEKRKEQERRELAMKKKRMEEERVEEERKKEEQIKKEEEKKKEEERKRMEEERKKEEERKRIEERRKEEERKRIEERRKEEEKKKKEMRMEEERIEQEKRREEEEREKEEEAMEEEVPVPPTFGAMRDSDDEMGDLMIDDGPDSPPPAPEMPFSTGPMTSPTVPEKEPVSKPGSRLQSPKSDSGKEPEWPVEPPVYKISPTRAPSKSPIVTRAVRPDTAAAAAAVADSAPVEPAAPEADAAAAAAVDKPADTMDTSPPSARIKRNFIKSPPSRPFMSGGPLRGSAIASVRNRRGQRDRDSHSSASSGCDEQSSVASSQEEEEEAGSVSSEAASETTVDAAVAASVASAAAVPVVSAAPTMEEKRRAAISGIAAKTSSLKGGRGARGGGIGGGVGRGGRAGIATSTARPSTAAGGSQTAMMASKMAQMAKNLRGGRSAISGTARPTPATAAAAATRAAKSSSRETTPPSQQPSTSAAAAAAAPVTKAASFAALSAKATAAVAAGKKVAAAAAKLPPSVPRPRKRKAAAFSAVEAVAVRAAPTSNRAQANPAAPSTARSAENNLTSSIINVCMGTLNMEKALKTIDMDKMTVKTFVDCVVKALGELPQSNTWHVVVSAKMTFKSLDEFDRTKVVPKPERLLFQLLMEVQDRYSERLGFMFNTFFDVYCLAMMKQITSSSSTTCDVTRSVRCLFFALHLSERTAEEKEDEAIKFFVSIIKRKPSAAVCQSLVFLLCQPETASLASAVLRAELDDDEKGGRFISMHMNDTKSVDILRWAIGLFADESCKNKKNLAHKTPATKEMVLEWWESDMEFVERARDQPTSVTVSPFGKIQFDACNRELMHRMTMLLSPMFRIAGLDRIKLLTQLDTPAIDTIDRLTASGDEGMGYGSMFADTSSVPRAFLDAGEARVIVLRLQISVGVISSFYADCLYGSDQRDELRLHLRDMVERVHSILDRPACKPRSGGSSPESNEENALPMAIIALCSWRDAIRGLTRHNLKGTPEASSAESSPVKKKIKSAGSSPAQKKPRSEEYGNDEP